MSDELERLLCIRDAAVEGVHKASDAFWEGDVSQHFLGLMDALDPDTDWPARHLKLTGQVALLAEERDQHEADYQKAYDAVADRDRVLAQARRALVHGRCIKPPLGPPVEAQVRALVALCGNAIDALDAVLGDISPSGPVES